MLSCSKCLLPETAEATSFDDHGSCSVCAQIEVRDTQINWDERHAQMRELVAQYRDKGLYDCIVPYSGGKDSVFQLWYVVKKLGLKPLVVRFDHWFYRRLIEENNTSVFKQLGVDVLNFTPNWHVVRELMLESLKRRGDFCWHCHTGIYAHTMQIAIRYETPLLFWGESLCRIPVVLFLRRDGGGRREALQPRHEPRHHRRRHVRISRRPRRQARSLSVRLSAAQGTDADQVPLDLPRQLHQMGHQEARRDDQARARLEGPGSRGHSAANTTTKRSNASSRACATT